MKKKMDNSCGFAWEGAVNCCVWVREGWSVLLCFGGERVVNIAVLGGDGIVSCFMFDKG